jgi:polyferredoxin
MIAAKNKTMPFMSKNNKTNLPRLLIQYSVIGFLLIMAARSFSQKDYTPDYEAYCPFGGIQALSSFLLNNSLACSMTSVQISMGIMLILGIILFSKLFCSYVCPVGTISEWLSSAGDRYKISLKVNNLTDKLLRSIKYLLLFITFYFTLESNELFCKKYDPFYAVASGFSSDVVVWYALATIALVLAGSLLIRLFWCKYLCPLGAISNIFRFSWLLGALLLGYLLLLKAGVQLSYVWPLSVICIGGYVLELRGQKLNYFQVVRIYRNENSCTSCQLCNRKCPQKIDVANLKVVNDIDCNLCGDCIEACPEKDTLLLNKKSTMKWLPPVAVIVLFILGLILSSTWELPTIDQRWGSQESLKNAAVFSQSGISSVKCYGSSMAFAAKMKKVNGVLGVATYVGTHKIKVFYDPSLLNDSILQAELFVPGKIVIRVPGAHVQQIKMASLLLDNFFDPADFDKLSMLLKEKTDALGIESEFSCPVTVRIYFPGDSGITESQLRTIVETRTQEIKSETNSFTLDMAYKVSGKIIFNTSDLKSYRSRMFEPLHRTFNWKTEYMDAMLDTLTVPVDTQQYDSDMLPYFVSHLSNDDGVVGFHTAMDSINTIFFKVVYVNSMTNSRNIINAMHNDTLTVNYEDGEKGKMANKFKFEN